MQLPSASIISAWPAPNYINPVTRGPMAIIVITVLLSLVTLLLIVRIYTRLRISKGFGLDDVFILLAYIPTAGFGAVAFLGQLKFDWGRHVWDLPFEFITPGLQLSLISQLLFDLATTLTKLSMLSLIYRVVSVNNGPYKYVVAFVTAIVSLDGLVFLVLVAFQCNPISAYWTLSVEPQNCFNQPKHLLAAGCINTLTDFIIVVLPIPYVRRLKLPRSQKVTIASLFAGGIFVTLAGAARTIVTFTVFNEPDHDLTWNAIPVVIVSALELYIGIICASLPSVKPFFARYLPQTMDGSVQWIPTNSSPPPMTATDAASQKTLDKQGFWRVSSRESEIVDQDAWRYNQRGVGGTKSPPPLVIQTREQQQQQSAEPVATWTPITTPTPTRPPRTPSTMRPFSFLAEPMPYLPSFSTLGSGARTPSISTTSTSILELAPKRSNSNSSSTSSTSSNTPPDLNKPLPMVRASVELDAWETPEYFDPRRAVSTAVTSIYKFVPHQDGSISVQRVPGNGGGSDD